jgi:uncharacterized membrane protein
MNRRINELERRPEPAGGQGATATIQQVAMSSVTQRTGPIPAADELAKYAEINPDLVNRIVAMAESEQKARHGAVARSNYSALIVAIAGFAAAAFISHDGHQWAAAIIGALDIGGLVGAFLLKNRAGRPSDKA